LLLMPKLKRKYNIQILMIRCIIKFKIQIKFSILNKMFVF